jgi:biopolymer transport protein ExbD
MRRRKLTGARQDEAEVNITPLLDIVFIMLIFFIVTATFLDEVGIGLLSPEDEPPEQETRPPPTLVLDVQRDGFVRVDGMRLIDPRSVSPVVEEFKARQPRGVVLVNAAPEARAETTVMVLDRSRQAGVDAALTLQRAPQ